MTMDKTYADRRDSGSRDRADSETVRPASYQPGHALKGTLSRGQNLWRQIRRRLSFWTFVGGMTAASAVYLFLFAESMYVSESMISLQHKSSVSQGASSILGSALTMSSTASQDAALVAYIESHEMLAVLEKKFGLRVIYSDYHRNPFWRLAKNASQEDFLDFYRGMVEVDLQYDVSIITVDVLDYDSARAKAIAEAIITESERFMNKMSDEIREETLRFARTELSEAMRQVSMAQTAERQIAEMRLQSAQAAMATALSIANQQQVFVVRISNPTLPSTTTRPQRLLNLAAIALASAVFYAIAFLILANVRDHRPI
jgi:capsular polysaccharide transport system permease protein